MLDWPITRALETHQYLMMIGVAPADPFIGERFPPAPAKKKEIKLQEMSILDQRSI